MSDEFDFSNIEPVVIPVKIGSESFTLEEPSSAAVGKFREAQIACRIYNAQGNFTGFRGLSGTEPYLVALCLFNVKRERVSQDLIASWPAKIVRALFEKAKELGGIKEEAPEKAQLIKALSMVDAPITAERLITWIKALPEDEFRLLQYWAEDLGEKVKNS